MNPCLHARKHFSDAIDGNPLPPLTAIHVGLHRLLCPFCKRYEKSLKHTVHAAKALRDLPFQEDDGNESPPRPTGGA